MDELDEETRSKVLSLLDKNESGDRRLKVNRQFASGFFRGTVLDKFGGKCSVCGTDGKKDYITTKGKPKRNPLVVHHKDYDWNCPYEKERASLCQKCYGEHRPKFDVCFSKVVLLCDMCHYKLHNKQKKTTGSWV